MSTKSLDEIASELVLNHEGPLGKSFTAETQNAPTGHLKAVMDYMQKSDESSEFKLEEPDSIEQDAKQIVPTQCFAEQILSGPDSDTSLHGMPVVNEVGVKEPNEEHSKYFTEQEARQAAKRVTNKSLDVQKSLEKAGPFIGPKGGKWADPQHKIPWKAYGDDKSHSPIMGKTKSGKEITRIPKADKYYEKWSARDHRDAEELWSNRQSPHAGSMKLFHKNKAEAKLFEETGSTSGMNSANKDANRFRNQARKVIKEHNKEQQAKHELEEVGKSLNVQKSLETKGLTQMQDYLNKATPIGGTTPGGYKRVAKDKYVKVGTKQKEAKAGNDKAQALKYYQSAGEGKIVEVNHEGGSTQKQLNDLPKGAVVTWDPREDYADTPDYVKLGQDKWVSPEGRKATTKQITNELNSRAKEHDLKFNLPGKFEMRVNLPKTEKSLEGLDAMNDYLEKSGSDLKGNNNEHLQEKVAKSASDGAEPNTPPQKPVLEGLLALEKALPKHDSKMDAGNSNTLGGSANGGDLKGTGTTSGAIPAAPGPGQDADGQLKGVDKAKTQKLSEDDKEEEGQMKPHKKPIEITRKSVLPAGQRETVAYEIAQYRAKLEKAADGEKFLSADEQAAAFAKNEGFYVGNSPTLDVNRNVLLKGFQTCPECNEGFNKSLSGCPSCGWNAMGHRVLPSTFLGQNSIKNKPMLRKAQQEPDIVIGGGGPAYIVKTM